MIEIKLFKFNKKPNSTKRPAGYVGTTFTCAVKSAASVLGPVVDIKVENNNRNIAFYNYAYIEDFKRYYFIIDIVYNEGIWTLSLACDLLATYRSDIISSKQYVIRSANKFNPDIVDTLYLSKIMPLFNRTKFNIYEGATFDGDLYEYGVRWHNDLIGRSGFVPNYFDSDLSSGEYVVSIIGNNATGVEHYAFSYNGLKDLINKAFTLTPSDMSDVSSGIAKALYNPIQYITSCRWYPSVVATGTSTNSIKIGPYTLTLGGSYASPVDIKMIPEFYIDIHIPRHPDWVNYPYMKLSPYSEYNLYFQPFGNIPLDSTKIYGSEDLHIFWAVDYTTGQSHLKIKTLSHAYREESIIYDTVADYGVTIPISSLVTDFKTGAIMSGMTWVKGAIDKANNIASGADRGNSVMNNPQYANAINAGVDIGKPMSVNINTSTIDKAMDALGSAMGQVHTVGNSGSFLAYNSGKPFVYAFFYDQADRDPERFGRPFYSTAYLYTITGYCICSNAVINFEDATPMADEYNAIIAVLNSGVYIE